MLANDVPVFHELVAAHATFFDIHREGDLGAKVERLVHEGRQPVAGFSWPTWSEQAHVLFEDLVARSRGAALEPRRERTAPEAARA
ncbi:MAG TPA: hypothetical protein VEU33_38130 [Archangium sp.]|nr:hypothetical protein [Archangium sp.]